MQLFVRNGSDWAASKDRDRPLMGPTRVFPAPVLGAWVVTLLLASAVHAAPRDVETWVAIDSPSFTLYTDGTARRGAEISARLEQFRGVFARLSPSLELKSPAPTTLFAFRDAASYAPFKSRADSPRTRILGQFSRTRDGNYLTLDASASMAGSFGVLYHEYVHFLVLNNFPNVPLWFNEGLAEYYSTFEVEGDRGILGLPVERHLRWLRDETDFSLDELLDVDSEGAASHDADEVGRFYAMSWLLVHYLLSGGEHEIDGIVDYFGRLHDGEDPERAFERSFDRHLSSVADELRVYVQAGNFASRQVRLSSAKGSIKARAMAPADVLYHLGDLSVHMNRTRQGEAFFHQALEHDPRHADVHAGLAHIRDIQQRFEEAAVLYQDAMKARPYRVLSWLHYARHSLTLAQAGRRPQVHAERGRKALAEALLRMPDFGEAHSLNALALALPGGDLDQAVAAIKKARRLLPSRLDLVSRHIRLLIQRRDLKSAERLLSETFEPQSRDYQLVSELWQDIDRTHLLIKAEKELKGGDPQQGIRYLDEAISLTTREEIRRQLEDQLAAIREQLESSKP